MVAPQTILTHCKNGAVTTNNGDEFMLQNERGNKQYITLPNGYEVLAAQEYNSIIYFVANNNGYFEVGSYPSMGANNSKVNAYSAFKTLNNSDFKTKAISISKVYNLELQPSFDGSINLILSNDKYQPLLINSGFYEKDNKLYRNDISYNLNTLLDDVKLVKTINTISTVDFLGTTYGGDMLAGNYKFFFKYSDIDGNESDIFAETQNINIVFGDITQGVNTIRGGLLNENTGKILKLKLSNLDTSYKYVNVYYTRTSGDETVTTEYKKIDKKFDVSNTINISINGLEDTEDISDFNMFKDNVEFSSAQSIAQVNNNLFVANIGKSYEYSKIKDIISNVTLSQVYDEEGIGWFDSEVSTSAYNKIEVTLDELINRVHDDTLAGNTRGNMYFVTDTEATKSISMNVTIKGTFEGLINLNGNKLIINIYNPITSTKGQWLALFENIKAPAGIINGKLTINNRSEFYHSDLVDTGILSYSAGIACNAIKGFGNITFNKLLLEVTNSVMSEKTICYCSAIVASSEIGSNIKITDCNIIYKPDYKNCIANIQSSPLCALTKGAISVDKSIIFTQASGIVEYPDTLNSSRVYVSMTAGTGAAITQDIDLTITRSLIDADIKNVKGLTNRVDVPLRYFQLVFSPLNASIVDCIIYNRPSALWPPVSPEWSNDYSEMIIQMPLSQSTNRNPYNIYDFTTLEIKDIFTIPEGDNLDANSIGVVFSNTIGDSKLSSAAEYYSESNMYYKLGYMPNEYYKFGLLCIMNGGQVSPVFLPSSNGVIRIDNGSNLFDIGKNVKPIGIKFNITSDIKAKLKALDVIGVIPVRQKRIPNFLCNGLMLPTTTTGVPLIYSKTGSTETFKYESIFKEIVADSGNAKFVLNQNNQARFLKEIDKSFVSNNCVMISPDIMLNSAFYSSVLNNGDFVFKQPHYQVYSMESKDNTLFTGAEYKVAVDNSISSKSIKYINEFSNGRKLTDVTHKAVFGDKTNIQSTPLKLYGYNEDYTCKVKYEGIDYFRGITCPYLAVSNPEYKNGLIRNIYLQDPDDINVIDVVVGNSSPFFTIANRFDIRTSADMPVVFGGDCFIGEFTARITRNFTDNETPNQDVIIKPDFVTNGNSPMGEGGMNLGQFEKDGKKLYNTADINAVQMGVWVKFKAISNVNLIYRSVDASNALETNLKSERGFYPYKDISFKPEDNVADSYLANKAYSMTSTTNPYFDVENLRSIKDYFPTRILYSKPHVSSLYVNNFRIFEQLSFAEYPLEFGEITEIKGLGNNLLIIFKNGVAITPINERVLAGSGVGGDVYVTSPNVITSNINTLSDNIGATNQEHTIKSNFSVYGIDIIKKKIWRTDGSNFEVLSTMKIQKFLNGLTITKASVHYDKFKNNVYFIINDSINISYNELIGEFVSFNSWITDVSVNAHNVFNTVNNNKLWSHSIDSTICNFYGKQYDFEFEFVVNAENPSVQKIYDNLKIISNKCLPSELTITTSGDAYNVDGAEIVKPLFDISKVGRLKGNMQYKENVADIVLPAMMYNGRKSKIRDKYIKIKLKYTGSNHVIIHSIITLYNMSYA